MDSYLLVCVLILFVAFSLMPLKRDKDASINDISGAFIGSFTVDGKSVVVLKASEKLDAAQYSAIKNWTASQFSGLGISTVIIPKGLELSALIKLNDAENEG